VLLFNAGSKGGFPLLISPVMITNGRGGGVVKEQNLKS
jgi:formate-dependent phosphoribosylglycinamide formyltransferase (GAR transformylase)